MVDSDSERIHEASQLSQLSSDCDTGRERYSECCFHGGHDHHKQKERKPKPGSNGDVLLDISSAATISSYLTVPSSRNTYTTSCGSQRGTFGSQGSLEREDSRPSWRSEISECSSEGRTCYSEKSEGWSSGAPASTATRTDRSRRHCKKLATLSKGRRSFDIHQSNIGEDSQQEDPFRSCDIEEVRFVAGVASILRGVDKNGGVLTPHHVQHSFGEDMPVRTEDGRVFIAPTAPKQDPPQFTRRGPQIRRLCNPAYNREIRLDGDISSKTPHEIRYRSCSPENAINI